MATNKPEQEPSIEEILASIRQIISDDDETRPAGDIELPQDDKSDIPLYQPDSRQEPSRESFAEILDLTNEVNAEEQSIDYSEEKFTIPVSTPPAREPEISRASDLDLSAKPEPATRPAPTLGGQDDIDALFSAPAAMATTEAFSRLLGNIPVEREENKRIYADGRITLEDIAKDLLRPMLRQWVDEHVPAMVERLVEKELEKLARQARD
jgi:cell pole-organizing protein PopZ